MDGLNGFNDLPFTAYCSLFTTRSASSGRSDEDNGEKWKGRIVERLVFLVFEFFSSIAK